MLPVLRKAIAFSGLAIVLGASACQGSGRSELLVFAAASLTDSLTEVGRAFESQGGTDVSFSYGASQLLAQQIVKGAPADVFISAGEFPVGFLAEKGLVGSVPVSLLSNKLVLVTRPGIGPLERIEDLGTDLVGRLALADPDLAPAGAYRQGVPYDPGALGAASGKAAYRERRQSDPFLCGDRQRGCGYRIPDRRGHRRGRPYTGSCAAGQLLGDSLSRAGGG